MEQIFDKAIKDGIISFNDDNSKITYIKLNKSRNFNNPEEKVQAFTYLSLIYVYEYPVERIDMFVTVPMGSSTKEADIVVYQDDNRLSPYIVIECKKEDVSEAEFKNAVDQGFSYAYALPGTTKYVWVTSKLKNEYYKYDKESLRKDSIPDIPSCGKQIPLFKFAKGGRIGNENPGSDPIKLQWFDLEEISEADLSRIFRQAHQSLWAGGQLNPSEAFDELDKLIFCKIWDERKPRKNGDAYDFQIMDFIPTKPLTQEQKEEQITLNLFNRIRNLYEEGRKKDREVFKDNIRLTPQRVRTVVSYLQGINLSDTDLDSKGRAFEAFMGSYFRGDFGQFFTPRNVVKFIVSCLPITNESMVLDSSCGSGGFLLYALDKVRTLAGEYYKEGSIQHYNFWHNFASNNLFGIEINEQIARSAKMNMIIHDDGHTNVISCDGLVKPEVIESRTGNKGFEYGTFDFIITNPPFGSTVKQTESAYLHQYKLGNRDVDWLDTKNSAVKNRDSQSTEVLFIEQDYNFLKEGGILAIVIPDGILTNSSLQYVRNRIQHWYRIIAVISLPQTTFSANGAGVKSSVMFLRKWSKGKTEQIISNQEKLQNELKTANKYVETIENWEKEKKERLKKHDGFENNTGKTDRKEIEATDAFKNWKKELTDLYNQKVSNLKDKLQALYDEKIAKLQDDYDIFMAIAEEIGYDATGRVTPVNELDTIAPELERYINYIVKEEAF